MQTGFAGKANAKQIIRSLPITANLSRQKGRAVNNITQIAKINSPSAVPLKPDSKLQNKLKNRNKTETN